MAYDLPKLSTGIAGLDAILRGGLPQGRTTLLHGGTGTGKTILGIQFLVAGADNGESGILVSFEERAEAIRENVLALGWDLEQLEKQNKLIIIDALPDPGAIQAGGFDFSGFFALLEGACRAIGATRVVIDAIDILLQLLNDAARKRSQVCRLNDWLSAQGLSAILTAKLSGGIPDYPFMEYLTDCVIRLAPLNEDRQRLLSVIKFRGSNFSSGAHPYTIAENGFILNSLGHMEMRYETVGLPVPTGLPTLDEMIGGGYRRGSSIALAGASGTGKTTFSCQFAAAACARGERVLYINFEESANNMTEMMRSSGLELRPFITGGHLEIVSLLPETAGSEEHLHHNFVAMERHKTQHVVIDAISSCRRMGTDKAAFSYLLRMLNFCRERGITILLTNQITGFQQAHEFYGIGFSSIIDTLIFLDYVQVGGEVNRTVMILKARGSQHSNQYREFTITGAGLEFKDIYTGKGGMLTGVARVEQEYREELEARQRVQAIRVKRSEIESMRTMLSSDVSKTESRIEKAMIELDALETEDKISEDARRKRAMLRTRTDTDPVRAQSTPVSPAGGEDR